MAALDAVGQKLPVERWRAAGLGAWPLFRYELATTNHYLLNSTPPRAIAQSPTVEVDHENDAILSRRDAVFYSDGVSFAQLGGRYFEKFCDPLMARVRNDFGLSSLLLTPMNAGRVPRRSKSILVQKQIDVALTLSKVSARLRATAVELEGYDDAIQIIERLLPGAKVPTPQRLFRNAHISKRLSWLCEIWLRIARPRVVFVVAYYGNERAAMVLACRRLGIPCVDVQHGAVSDIHFAYTGLGRLPVGGYELLPDWFWVWTDDDKRRIERWAAASNGRHRVVTGGNPFVTYCTQGDDPDLRAPRELLASAIAARAGKQHVLFSANGYETNEQLRVLSTIVQKTEHTHAWWLRMHPARLEAIERFRSALAPDADARSLLEPASSLPLPLLLAQMQLHVTEGSSTAEEAALFGVATVLFAKEGTTQFAPLLERGFAVAVDELAQVPEGLARAATLTAPHRANGGAKIERAALQVVLGK